MMQTNNVQMLIYLNAQIFGYSNVHSPPGDVDYGDVYSLLIIVTLVEYFRLLEQ